MNESLFASLFAEGEKVLLACSGGKDSVYLLERLFHEKQRLGIALGVAHVDHGLRPESAGDAKFVRELALDRGLPYFERRLDLAKKDAPQGIEALARETRYLALEEIARDEGYARVATAHHRDDQIETVLLRILQGAAPRHWLGMSWERALRQGSPVRLVRPLLDISRLEIKRTIATRSLAWREDASNRDLRFLRNRIRHFLASIGEVSKEEIAHAVFSTRARALALTQCEQRLENVFLRSRLRVWDDCLWLDLRRIENFPKPFLESLIENLLRRLDGHCPAGTVEAILQLWHGGRTGALAHDPAGIRIQRHRDGLEFRKANASIPLMA